MSILSIVEEFLPDDGTDFVGETLIATMAWSAGIMALTFFLLWLGLHRQKAELPLGRWINVLFFLTFANATLSTMLAQYLTNDSTPSDLKSWVEWSLVIGLNAIPIATAFAGIKVAIWTRREVKAETKNERDIRQDARSVQLDHTAEVQAETGVVLAKRGKRLSDAGIELDKRVVTMSEERQDLDDRRQEMNDEQAAGRSALDDTIIHTGEDVEAMKVDVEHIRDKMNGETP